jgi:hypothetical protein
MVVNYINSHAYLYHTKQSIIDLFKNNPELKKERFSLNHAGRKKFKLKD